jgi:hypothetical protein
MQSARRAYDEGSAHYVAGRYAEALLSFEHAYTLRPNPVVLLPVIECHDRLGHIPEAIRALELYLQTQPQARNRPLLESRLENLRRRPARLHVITVPPGAAVTVDGRNVAQIAPTNLELAPGRHTIGFTLRDHLATTREVDVLPGTARDELVSLERDPSVEAQRSAARSRLIAPTAPSRGPSALVWLSASLAFVGLAAGTTFGVLALTENNVYDRSPSAETRERGLRYALVSDVSFGAAVGAAVVALVMYAVERNRVPAERRSVTLSPSATGLTVRF